MIPVEQREFYDAEKGTRGDCLKCCMASLLELGYDDVPHFAAMGDRWHSEWTNWTRARGWVIGNPHASVDPDDNQRLNGWPDGYWLAGVTSLRTYPDGRHLSHVVVMLDRDLVWDPHPDRAQGHLGYDGHNYLLRPYDPARFVLKDAA